MGLERPPSTVPARLVPCCTQASQVRLSWGMGSARGPVGEPGGRASGGSRADIPGKTEPVKVTQEKETMTSGVKCPQGTGPVLWVERLAWFALP